MNARRQDSVQRHSVGSRQEREPPLLGSGSAVGHVDVAALGNRWVNFDLLAGLGHFVGGRVDVHVDSGSRFGLGDGGGVGVADAAAFQQGDGRGHVRVDCFAGLAVD
jgi:hypothetical protein